MRSHGIDVSGNQQEGLLHVQNSVLLWTGASGIAMQCPVEAVIVRDMTFCAENDSFSQLALHVRDELLVGRREEDGDLDSNTLLMAHGHLVGADELALLEANTDVFARLQFLHLCLYEVAP